MNTQPREVPFLMSTAMVQATLDRRKTQTRRTSGLEKVNHAPSDYRLNSFLFGQARFNNGPSTQKSHRDFVLIPKAKEGDLIWVKEMHYAWGRWVKNGLTETGKQKWRFVDETLENGLSYQYEDTMRHKEQVVKRPALGWHRRPSMFMPKRAARMWLRCTGVKAERVQDISTADIMAEGVQIPCSQEGKVLYSLSGKHCTYALLNELEKTERTGEDLAFFVHWAKLWIDLNGRESWDENPWVWAYSFDVLSTDGRPTDT